MRCAECIRDSPEFDLSDQSGHQRVIEHYLDEHPQSEKLHDVVDGTFVVVECRDCSEEFWSPVDVDATGLYAEGYCSDCVEEDRLRKLYVQELTAEEYIRLEGTPPGDSATKQGGDSPDDVDQPIGVTFEDLPITFDVLGFKCYVTVHETELGPSHFCGYVDLPPELHDVDVAPLLEAPGGITYADGIRIGFDTGHAYMLNVDDDGQPLPGGGNEIEDDRRSEMTTIYDAQAAVDATADLARALARGSNLAGEVDR